ADDTGTAIDADGDGVGADEDCDDNNPFFGSIVDDADCDGATEAEETEAGSDPLHPDTDGDWVMDGQEIDWDRSPTLWEPLQITLTEGDEATVHLAGNTDLPPVDVAFLLDTTCSLSSSANALASEFNGIVERMSVSVDDIQYGFATFDDYAFAGYGYSSSGDRPFILRQQITDQPSRVQSALLTIPIHFGGDASESGIEALYQTLTGTGYDQDCNGVFDADTDVLPFISSLSDPFGGTSASARIDDSSGGGTLGGIGFRAGSKPVIVYMTEHAMRDADDDSFGVPGGCPGDAGSSDVVEAATAMDATLIGIEVDSIGTATAGMEAIAMGTGSMIDGEPLVFSWTGS
ncbi:MAG: hypothetical protein ACPGTU_18045, partial [Myxococcota bacterium]